MNLTSPLMPKAPILPNKNTESLKQSLGFGLHNNGPIYSNCSPARWVELALERGEGLLSDRGSFVAWTGDRTGRSPRDRFIVSDERSEKDIAWGKVNQPIDPDTFDHVLAHVRTYLQQRELFVCDAWACADPEHRLPVRVIAEKAWHALFAHQLLIPPPHSELAKFVPELTVIHAGDMKPDADIEGLPGEAFILLNLSKKLVLIGGTLYAGEIKKAVFSWLNYLLPSQGVFPMHCSANIGSDGETALFFGLSGTGKTTLSADPDRSLIGDDEHGWSGRGVFNIEGGCYAKCVDLSEAGEPQIWNALHFGSILENVVLNNETRIPDFTDTHFTENTRAAYPVDYIERVERSGQGGHPKTVIFLTCDAFGALPPISRLTPEQAMYHFLSGYTAKIAGTEAGVTEPDATFSTCFGEPFLPLAPARYGEMLQAKLREHQADVWLINTGWTGGGYGEGKRIPLAHTRSMVRAALNEALKDVSFVPDPHFQVAVPESCPDVPSDLLHPRQTWSNSEKYDQQARRLARLFQENFQQYANDVTEDVRQAGPVE